MPDSKNSKLVVSAIGQCSVQASYTRMRYKMKPTYYFFLCWFGMCYYFFYRNIFSGFECGALKKCLVTKLLFFEIIVRCKKKRKPYFCQQ